jgi:hypothetical protein
VQVQVLAQVSVQERMQLRVLVLAQVLVLPPFPSPFDSTTN